MVHVTLPITFISERFCWNFMAVGYDENLHMMGCHLLWTSCRKKNRFCHLWWFQEEVQSLSALNELTRDHYVVTALFLHQYYWRNVQADMTHLQIITKDDMAVSNLKFIFSVITCTRWWQTQCITSSPLSHCSCSMMLQAIALHGSYSNICSWTVTPLIQLGSWYLLFGHNTAWVIFQLSLFLNCDTIHTSWILLCLFTTSCLKHLQWSHCQFSQMLTKLYVSLQLNKIHLPTMEPFTHSALLWKPAGPMWSEA